MRILIFILLLLPNLVFAQTTQQVELLNKRIEADKAIILQDQADIEADKNQFNDAIAIKQAEIDTLTQEINGAMDFLNPVVPVITNTTGTNWSDLNAISSPIVNP